MPVTTQCNAGDLVPAHQRRQQPRPGWTELSAALRFGSAVFLGTPESLYATKPLRELAEATRAAVIKEFKQTPENIVLAFSLGRDTPGTAAQAGQTTH